MAAANENSATCACGNVVFNLDGHNVGDVLTCVACKKQYRVDSPGHITALIAETSSQVYLMNGGESIQTSSKSTSTSPTSDWLKPQSGKKKAALSSRTANGTERVKVKAAAEIPGGIGPMITFMVVFNGIALVAMALLMPHDDSAGGARKPVWGGSIDKDWDWLVLVIALLIGHIVGFLGWALYVYKRHHKADDSPAEGAPKPESKNDPARKSVRAPSVDAEKDKKSASEGAAKPASPGVSSSKPEDDEDDDDEDEEDDDEDEEGDDDEDDFDDDDEFEEITDVKPQPAKETKKPVDKTAAAKSPDSEATIKDSPAPKTSRPKPLVKGEAAPASKASIKPASPAAKDTPPPRTVKPVTVRTRPPKE